MPCLKRLVPGPLLRSPGFHSRSFHVRFVMDKVALRQVFFRVLRFSPASIIPPMFLTHLRVYLAFTWRRNGRSRNFPKAVCYRTFPVLGWACSFPSAQQACRSFFRVIYVGGPLKGPQLTTTADTLTPTRYCVFSLILFINWNIFYKTWIQFCLIYSKKSMENAKVNRSHHGTWSKYWIAH